MVLENWVWQKKIGRERGRCDGRRYAHTWAALQTRGRRAHSTHARRRERARARMRLPRGTASPPPVTLALWLPRALTADGASGRDQVTIASHPLSLGPAHILCKPRGHSELLSSCKSRLFAFAKPRDRLKPKCGFRK